MNRETEFIHVSGSQSIHLNCFVMENSPKLFPVYKGITLEDYPNPEPFSSAQLKTIFLESKELELFLALLIVKTGSEYADLLHSFSIY